MLSSNLVHFVVILTLIFIEKNLALVGKFSVNRNPQAYYEVSITYKNNHICTGTVISRIHAITTARCICNKGHDTKHLRVKGGSNNLSVSASYLVYNVLCYDNSPSDISTIVFVQPLNVNTSIWPIKILALPIPPEAELILTGWNDNELQGVNGITLTPNKYYKMVIDMNLSRYFICSISPQFADTAGDPGAPLVYGNTVVGIFAWKSKTTDLNGNHIYVYIKLSEKKSILKELKSKYNTNMIIEEVSYDIFRKCC